jgi:hypothetical protein
MRAAIYQEPEAAIYQEPQMDPNPRRRNSSAGLAS